MNHLLFLAADHSDDSFGWSAGLGVGLACFGFFAGLALLAWAFSKL